MFSLRFSTGFEPAYMTKASAGADLKSTEYLVIPPGCVGRVPTGVFIDRVEWDQVPKGFMPELQIRARSGLAFKKQITLANGVGTIDADYPDEICVLLLNLGSEPFVVNPGDRIAQLVVNMVGRLQIDPPETASSFERTGGFGSTGL
ncbi:MAG: dUTP diphosphatase [Proteobacteria bacterium]|nr:dUTP diphosphatase [Pseudomonadota bacterium]